MTPTLPLVHPQSPLARLTRALVSAGELPGFAAWEARPGTGFREQRQWWDGRPRAHPHEGVDLVAWRDGDGHLHPVTPGLAVRLDIPAPVTAVCDDILAQTVFLAVQLTGAVAARILVAHLQPAPGVAAGVRLPAGAAIGTPAPGTKVPCHIHLSLLAGPSALLPEFSCSWRSLAGHPEFRHPGQVPVTALDGA